MQTFESHRSSRGIALVLVLGFLVILSALVIAFFSSVTTVSTSARSYASGVSANLLADTAVQMVMAQIRQATTPPTPTSQTAWTSQPGMIRVFGTVSGAGGGAEVAAASTPYAYYKLYSSDNMVVSAGQIAGYQPATEYAGFTEPTQAPLFTDINSPILAPDSAGPIVVNSSNYRADYPVLDPSAVNYVEGLSITTPPGYGNALPPSPSYNPASSGNPAPMPVKWLYMLRDGTMVAPTAASQGVATFSGSGSQLMTKDNPIVGRIAFWTDDETCKVNLNTASEGTFWDTPMVSSTPESALGLSQPTKNEFQRYPGHPSTVCLSPILGKAFGLTIPNPASSYLPNPIPASFKTSIYGFAPRVQEGGSTEGSISVSTSTKPVTLDFDRLYGSVDEYLFKAPPPPAAPTRIFNDSRITNTTLERTKFFLTAYSRAPELNLYGQPRISIWPINTSTALRTPYDNVFAFCSTVGNQTGANSYPYYFTRQNPQSSTADFTGIPRNVALYNYLQTLTAHPVPGFTSVGFSFLQKYSTTGVSPSPDGPPAPERDQILTEIFDYIRCVNIADTSTGTKPYTPLDSTNYPDVDWSGQVVPIQIGTTRGFGRFPTVSEAVILFAPAPKQQGDAANTARMQATLLIESFCPSYGYTGLKDTYSVGVDFRSGAQLKITDPISGQPRSLNFPAISYNLIDVDPWHGTYGRIMGGYEGFSHTLWFNPSPGMPLVTAPPPVPLGTKQLNSSLNTAPGSLTTKVYPFVSDTILYNTGSGQGTTFSLLGGQFDILVYAGLNPGAQTTSAVQKLTISFPAGVFKVPFPTGTVPFGTRIATHIYGSISDGFLLTTDSTRSVEATTDLRLIAAHKTVPLTLNYFGQCSPGRWTSATPQANINSLRCSNGARYLTAVPTGILAHDIPRYRYDAGNTHGAAYADPRMADLPESINGVRRSDGQYGDWDSGFAKFTDGAFINRADEGNVATAQNVSYFQGSDYGAVGGTYFSPNRIICSPGWFGSLPTGVLRNLPYQTLLFRPDSPGRTNHPGLGLNGNPPDHLILDLFDMPVVEPYPMSEPFSTAGKINLNYQIMPFGKFLKRDTAMRSLLRSEKMLCVDYNALAGAHSETFSDDSTDYRHEIDETTTLAFLERKWNPTFTPAPQDQVFRSASQICEVDLYPRTNASGGPLIPVYSASEATQINTATIDSRWRAFWEEYRLTGDNDRERPYARLYSRVTTKSNTFTVHLRVQTLLKRTSDPNQATWDEGKDFITGEYRGSALVERYLDPADSRFTGVAASQGSNAAAPAMINPDSQSLEQAYKFRVVATKQFGP